MSTPSITSCAASVQEEQTTKLTDLPIVGETTASDQEGEAERPNKYLYPEFAGYGGERYLDTLVQKILPYALWRTWHYAVDYQAPGNVCYVGTARLASRVKPGIRKIELDFQELEARGLMRKYPDRLPIVGEDGGMKYEAVTVKDFAPLYALAHEYHLWIYSPEYIPPERDYVDLILANPELLAKLIRFDCYHRLIGCRKPGRKPQAKPAHLYYQCATQPAEQQPGSPAVKIQGRTKDQNPNLYSNGPDNISSPYRESESQEESTEIVSFSSPSEDVGGLTIRNERGIVAKQQPETESTKETNTVASKPKSNQPNLPTQEEMRRAERAKDAEEYNIEELKRNPLAMAAALLDMHRRQQSPSPASRSQRPEQEQRARRGTPEQLARYTGYYAQQLGGNPKFLQSDITRAAKIYWASTQIFTQFRNAWFLEQLQAAFAEAGRRRGIKRRVAYFFTCLENILELTPEERAYIRSDEPLYKDGNISDFIGRLQRQYERSSSTLEYEDWIRQNFLEKPLRD